MYALFAKCELNNPLIIPLQRMSGLTGRSAVIYGGDERRIRAESARLTLKSKVDKGLSTVIRRALHEGPLSGNEPNFAKVAICALLPLVNMRPMTAVSPKRTVISGPACIGPSKGWAGRRHSLRVQSRLGNLKKADVQADDPVF